MEQRRKGNTQKKSTAPVAKKATAKKTTAVKTKLYAPTKEQKAYKYKPTSGTGRRGAEYDATRRDRTVTEVTPFGRLGMVFCAFVFAGMVLFVLTGYEKITRAYADINTLSDSIDEAKLHIKELDVAIECAVNIQDAQAAATKFGMQYPTKSQYQKAGATISISAPTTTDDATGDGGNTGDTTTDPDGDTTPEG